MDWIRSDWIDRCVLLPIVGVEVLHPAELEDELLRLGVRVDIRESGDVPLRLVPVAGDHRPLEAAEAEEASGLPLEPSPRV